MNLLEHTTIQILKEVIFGVGLIIIGNEYALVTLQNGFSVVDVTNPYLIQMRSFLYPT